jgi:hypothetical protein
MTGNRRPALDLLPDRMDYVDDGKDNNYVTEFGQSLSVIGDSPRHVVNTPLIATDFEFSGFVNGRLVCSANQDNSAYEIDCRSSDGRNFQSRYVPTEGVMWFDYFCNSSSSVICRYNFKACKPFFSAANGA